MYLSAYLTLLQSAEEALAESYRQVAQGHRLEADVHYICTTFARQCDERRAALTPVVERYGHAGEPERLHPDGLSETRAGLIGLLRDLQDVYQLANLVDITWTLTGQAAHGARDRALIDIVAHCNPEVGGQLAWLRMRMKSTAPQALLVAS
ncbi:hypothetical protein FOS14_14125 [Skermania sp. ID1734]|uniref:hypothetical protein n=1 Tax=Skermania sp. ID1734 TaxID=2597516 RepID=UPI00117F0E8A|nr:hypothetical protein [Skermania sp. ID1734]TSD98121.1 hypothetical protein FOS14_14125 [Skermania sp. ID1734]